MLDKLMASELNTTFWGQLQLQVPKFEEIPMGCVWVPCIPDFVSNAYIPIYNLYTYSGYAMTQSAAPVKVNFKTKITRGGLKTKP